MAQTTKFTIDANLSGIQLRTQASEMLTALSTLNSGNLEPANPSAGMLWLDTTKNILKIRDKTNTAWLDFAGVNDKVIAASAADSAKLGGLAADKYATTEDIPASPQAATETKAGIVKLKNSITGSLSDTAVSEKAITDFFNSKFASSKNPAGYTKLSNGLIFQWGNVAEVPADGRKKAIFPIAFPTACLNASVTYEAVSAAGVNHGGMACFANISPSQMDVEYQALTESYANQPTATIYWFAIGY